MMPISIPALLLSSWIISALLMLWAWCFQRARHNAAIVDIAWYLSFALVAVGYAVATTGDPNRRLLVAIMAGTWGLRLAGYLYLDRILDKSEDARYQRIRRWFGKRAQGYFFLLFQGEALAIPVFSLPLLVLMQNTRLDFSLWEWAGVVLWMIALAGEWQADRQLVAFRAKPENQGKVCREGLWRYSRHPNYFFESLHWWAYVLMAIGLPYAWATVVAPIGMTVTLLWITGIPLAEAQALVTRGEEYREYQRTTSAFIPWFPKNT
jgi:steroid 5-alpha reductase family enzyme